MYQKLIDTVSSIVKTHGIGILSENRFWNILTDSYSFGSDYSLRDSFKKCIAEGYVSEIVSLKGKSQKTIDKIKDIVVKEHKISPSKDSEYTAILFSVSIAINSVSRQDYTDYLVNKSNPSSNTSTKSAHPKCRVYGYFLWGIIALCLCTATYYLVIFSDSIFVPLLLCAILQLSYCSDILKIKVKAPLSSEIKSISLPIIVGFILLDIGFIIVSIFFELSWSFLTGVYGLLGMDDLSTGSLDSWAELKNPYGFFSFLLNALLIFCVFSCGLGTISTKYSLKAISIRFYKKYIFISATTILFIYTTIFVIFNNLNYQTREIYLQEKQDLIHQNDELKNSRENKSIALGFKGISLGIDFNTCLGYADSIYVESGDSNQKYRILENTSSFDSSYFSRAIEGETDWDNQTIKLTIYELDGKVGQISISPVKGYLSDGFNDYDRIIKLYSDKYGVPEREVWSPMLRFFKAKGYIDRPYDWTYYSWTYKNGTITMNNNSIEYRSSSLIKLIDQQNRKEQQEKIEREREDQRRQQYSDSIAREEEKRDSIQRIRNHQNAINEI